ncbi:MAG TPA: hypothetical protein VFD19_01990 [Clostridia bacterium]|nr:hypothetical protein [Clostridia bacterium]
MKPVVLLMDKHLDFLVRMTDQLRVLAEGTYDVIAWSGDEAPDAHARVLAEDATVAVMPLCWKDHLCVQHICANHACFYWGESPPSDQPLYARKQPNNFKPSKERTDQEWVFVSRYAGARQLDRMIRTRMAEQFSFHKTDPRPDHVMGIHLSFSKTVGTRTTHHILNREMSRGRTVIYLPIQPLYALTESFRRGPQDTLGELLCRISSGDIPDLDDLGSLLYLHKRGYYTFRLPERADDLIACATEHLRQVACLLRAYTHSKSEPATAWIDPGGLHLDKLLAMAVLCDFIYVDAPTDETSAARVARRELGLFMARLPKSCAILELSAQDQKSSLPPSKTPERVINLASGL